MTIEQALRETVLQNATVATLLGVRLYWNQAPQGTDLPYAVFYDITADRLHTHDRGGSIYAGATETIFQFSAWAATIKQAAEIGRALIVAIEQDLATVGGLYVSRGRCDGGGTQYDPPPVNLHGFVFQASVWHG